MSWQRGPLVAFDLETTGVDVETARIVTASVLRLGVGRGVEARNWIVDPGIEIPDEAAAIHGVTTERARNEGQPAPVAVDEIASLLVDVLVERTPIVIYNAPYDLTVLHREVLRHTGAQLSMSEFRPVIDPLVIDRAVDKYRKGKRTLTAACEHYKVRLDEAHAAHGDAIAAARVAWRLAQTFDAVGSASPQELHERQVVWHAEWAAGFETYLRKKDAAAVVDRGWPWRPLADDVSAVAS